jgi:hypothetical protein
MPLTKSRRILDEVRDVMRLHHYSIHTERTCCDWIKKYVHFHGMNSRDDLKDGEKKIEAFLSPRIRVRGTGRFRAGGMRHDQN